MGDRHQYRPSVIYSTSKNQVNPAQYQYLNYAQDGVWGPNEYKSSFVESRLADPKPFANLSKNTVRVGYNANKQNNEKTSNSEDKDKIIIEGNDRLISDARFNADKVGSSTLSGMFYGVSRDVPTTLKGIDETYNISKPPTVTLLEPPVREGTTKYKFNDSPCGSGVMSDSRFKVEPGQSIDVSWIIQNPIKGRCKFSISTDHSDKSSSYSAIPVDINNYSSSSGDFEWGNSNKLLESAKLKIPGDLNCEDCTIQFSYTVPGFGTLYQCSDVTANDKATKTTGKECKGGCKNSGICKNGEWFCQTGFYGINCEQIGRPPGASVQFHEEITETESDSSSGIGFFAWVFILFFLLLLLLCLGAVAFYFLTKKGNQIKNLNNK